MPTIQVNCLQRDKQSGICEHAVLYVYRLDDGRIQDAETGYVYLKWTCLDEIVGWGPMDGANHLVLDGPCHEYLVPFGSPQARKLTGEG